MEVFVINAFAEDGLKGNPAGVCFVNGFPPPEKMRTVAKKAGFSETAFISPCGNSPSTVGQSGGSRSDNSPSETPSDFSPCGNSPSRAEFFIRWWTPQTEVALCGHATLAAAYMVRWRGLGEETVFVSTEHKITVSARGDLITMDFPADRAEKCARPPGLAEALGARIVYSGKNSADFLVEVASEKDVRSLRPDTVKLRSFDCRGIIATSRAETGGGDFVSRFFAPRVGIDEDPVTGSAHACLAPYWSEKTGKTKMKGIQLSERGGAVHTEICGQTVKIGGRAVFEGTVVC